MRTAYDAVPYPGNPFFQTHPDRLATIGTLFGMTPTPVDRCRVLELACGDGGNLIPMAFSLAGSQFVGIDLAGSAIDKGQTLIHTLGLTNIALKRMDIMDVAREMGEFDYIIAHGLYSWVPGEVRGKILAICKLNLNAQGIAFVSYNTYPGGHLRDPLREMMRFHVRNTSEAEEQIKQAKELLEFLIDGHPADDAYGISLRAEIKSFLERKPQHLYHDELAEHNARLYFYEFVESVKRCRLQCLGESRLASMQGGVYPKPVAERLSRFTGDDFLLREQYLDFVKLRKFRQTLLCHENVALDRTPKPDRVMSFSAATQVRPSSREPDIRSSAPEKFEFSDGGDMTTNHPLGKAALMHLGRVWPDSVPISALIQVARADSGRDTSAEAAPLEDDSRWMYNLAWKLYAAGLLELYTHPPKLKRTVSQRPVASSLARAQARQGHSVTNLRHGKIDLEDQTTRRLLILLDGTRDQNQLLAQLRETAGGTQISSDELETNLRHCAELALLIA
jgi:methyltransferase-like protein